MTSVCLFPVSGLERLRQFKQSIKATALAYDKVSHMGRKSCHKMQSIEAFGQHLVKGEQSSRIISLQEGINQ
jgi:hypothetical protein